MSFNPRLYSDYDSVRWMTIKTAALYINRTPRAVRHLVKKGKLTPLRFDRKIQLDRMELDRLLPPSGDRPKPGLHIVK